MFVIENTARTPCPEELPPIRCLRIGPSGSFLADVPTVPTTARLGATRASAINTVRAVLTANRGPRTNGNDESCRAMNPVAATPAPLLHTTFTRAKRLYWVQSTDREHDFGTEIRALVRRSSSRRAHWQRIRRRSPMWYRLLKTARDTDQWTRTAPNLV